MNSWKPGAASALATIALVVTTHALVAVLTPATAADGGKAPARGGEVFDRGARVPATTRKDHAARAARELAGERTSRSRTFLNRDGSLVTRIFAEPVNHRDDGGRWRRNSNVLDRAGAVFTNRANDYDVRLPENLDAPVHVREGAAAVSFELLGARGNAVARGDQARYGDVLPGVDALYEAGNSAVKETLVLERRAVPRAFRFRVAASGVRAVANGAGGIDFVRPGGAVAFSFAPPFMEDSSGTTAGFSRAVEMRLRRSGSGYFVTLRPDRAWLEDPARVFPVLLDPTIDFDGADHDCYIVERSPDTNFCGYEDLEVGYDGVGRSRALLKFDVAAHLPQQAEVLDAELELYLYAKTTANPTPVTLHRLTRAWSGSSYGATWNRYDGTSPWTTPGGDFESAAAASATLGTDLGFQRWNLTDLVQRWSDRAVPNHGLLMKAGAETVNNRLTFDSTHTSYDTPPYLEITYEPRIGALDRYEFDGEDPPDTVVDDDPEPPADPLRFDVNVANGNLLLRERDVLVEATGLDVEFERFYNNIDLNDTRVGGGWTSDSGIDMELVKFRDGSVALYGASGYAKTFLRNADGSFRSPSGVDAELTRLADGSYRLVDHSSGLTYVFDSKGCLKSRASEDGATQVFTYNSYDELVSITDGDGRKTLFSYDSAGYLSKITEPSGARHLYTHDGAGNLTSYVDPAGKRSTMSYKGFNLVRLVDRAGRDSRFTYDGYGRVTSSTRVTNPSTGTGPKTSYAYNQGNTVVTAPDGRRTTYHYDGASIVRGIDAGASPPGVTLAGTLPAQDNKTLAPNGSYTLQVTGQSAEGVREIRIDTDGDDEDDTTSQPCAGTTCTFTWTMESEEFTPGEAIIRATVVDANGDESSRVLVVTVPAWSPTSGPAAPPPPTKEQRIAAAQTFRSTFGLASDSATLEQRDSDPTLEEAREDWGVPLNAAEVSELEFRQDVQDATPKIEAYVAGSPSATAAYSGIYVDQRAGGMVKVGFTSNADQHLAAIRQTFPFPTRVTAFTAQRTKAALSQLYDRINDDLESLRAEGIDVNTVTLRIKENVVYVGVPSPSAAIEQRLAQRYGAGVRLTTGHDGTLQQNHDRFRTWRRIHAGLRITRGGSACTVAFSAYGRKRGRTVYRHLTAGHCGNGAWHQGGRRIGRTRVSAYFDGTNVDAQTISARRRRTSNFVFGPAYFRRLVKVESIRSDEDEGNMVCISGSFSGNSCGELQSTDHTQSYDGIDIENQRTASYESQPGDSGSPIYRKVRGRRAMAVGVHSGTTGCGFLNFGTCRVYSHASEIQQQIGLRICVRGRARCNR